MEDQRTDFDKGYHDGLFAAYREIESWSKARLDRLEPGKSQKMRDEVEQAKISLLHRIRHSLPIRFYPKVWE